jgi:hypothetical protein
LAAYESALLAKHKTEGYQWVMNKIAEWPQNNKIVLIELLKDKFTVEAFAANIIKRFLNPKYEIVTKKKVYVYKKFALVMFKKFGFVKLFTMLPNLKMFGPIIFKAWYDLLPKLEQVRQNWVLILPRADPIMAWRIQFLREVGFVLPSVVQHFGFKTLPEEDDSDAKTRYMIGNYVFKEDRDVLGVSKKTKLLKAWGRLVMKAFLHINKAPMLEKLGVWKFVMNAKALQEAY